MSENRGWKRFRALSFDRKRLSKQALKAETITRRHAHKFVVGRLRELREVRQHIISWLVLIVGIISLVALQMYWYQSGYRQNAAVEGGTYAEAIEGPIDTLNPLFASTAAEQSASQLLFSRLLDYDKTGHLRNDVASSVQIDSTQRIYTVKIRNDVRWHDNTKLTADDIVFTVVTMKNPDVRAVMGSNWHDVSVKKIDDKTVQFVLPAPYATFQHALTFAILPQHVLANVNPSTLRENTFSIAPVGSGVFKLRLLQTVATGKDTQKIVHMNRWDEYYRGASKLERFELHAYDKQESIARALRMSDVNAATGVQVTDDIPNYLVKSDIPINSGVYALLNNKSTLLSDVKVRQALQLGTDVVMLRKKTNTPNFPLDFPFIPSQVVASQLPSKQKTDVAGSNALLEQAGWKLNGTVRKKDTTTLKLKVVAVKDTRYKAVIDELTRQWNALGIEVEASVFDPETNQQSFAQAVLQPRMYDVLINELVIGGDADVYAYWHSSQAQATGYNFSNYSNPVSDDILSSARAKIDDQLRSRKYVTFAQQWLQDAPAIGLYQSSIRYVHTKTVTSVDANAVLPTSTDRYANILYWTADRKPVYKTP